MTDQQAKAFCAMYGLVNKVYGSMPQLQMEKPRLTIYQSPGGCRVILAPQLGSIASSSNNVVMEVK